MVTKIILKLSYTYVNISLLFVKNKIIGKIKFINDSLRLFN